MIVTIDALKVAEILAKQDEQTDEPSQSYIDYYFEILTNADINNCSKESFTITKLSKEDLEDKGYDTSNIDNTTMERLASKLSDAYVENSYWIDLCIMADYLGIPKK